VRTERKNQKRLAVGSLDGFNRCPTLDFSVAKYGEGKGKEEKGREWKAEKEM